VGALMAIFALGDRTPRVDPEAWVHESAQVVGDVVLAAGVTVWPGAVLRGDYGHIEVGPGSVVEDNCVIHAAASAPTSIGSHTVLGHLAHVEGCRIGDRVLIGSGSVVLREATIESGSMVAAAALVTPGSVVPSGYRAQGVPARNVRSTWSPEEIEEGAALYRRNGRRWQRELVRIDEEQGDEDV
jgi:carbonic anhydrase/acetyltransferase-like protein (isoleucine patch superfamily)